MLQRHFAGPAAVARAGTGQVIGVEVVAVPGAVGAGLPERRNGDAHQGGIALQQLFVVQAPCAHLSRPVVFYQYIRPVDEAQEQVAPGGAAHITGNAALVGIVDKKQAAFFRVRYILREGTRAAGRIALRQLDFDDIGTVVTEQLGAKRC